MRIAYVLTSLGIGGAERQVVALAERMRRVVMRWRWSCSAAASPKSGPRRSK